MKKSIFFSVVVIAVVIEFLLDYQILSNLEIFFVKNILLCFENNNCAYVFYFDI